MNVQRCTMNMVHGRCPSAISFEGDVVFRIMVECRQAETEVERPLIFLHFL